MAEILSNSLKSDTTRLFLSDINSNQDFYMFVSSVDTFDPNDTLVSKMSFKEKTLFGKKIASSDIHFCIPYYPWQVGQVYTEYDDTVDLEGKNFYAVVGPTQNDTGDYRIYKCLDNNNGSTVSNPPNYNSTTTNQLYKTADGYVWKYMYRLSDLEFEAYNALGFIPVVGMTANNAVIQPSDAGGSTISDVIVSNPTINNGYTIEEGRLNASPTGDKLSIVADSGYNFSPITNYYTGQYIYTTNSNGVSRLFEITYYFYDSNTDEIEIRVGVDLITGAAGPTLAGVSNNASITIFPKVEIKGDGTGAVAIPNIVDGQIVNITILQQGSGYHNVTAQIIDPVFDFDPEDATTTDIRAIVRAVMSPDGGHGTNLIDEFKCKNFSLYGYISAADNTNIGAVNTYSAVGVVRTPSFANTAPDVFDNRIAVVTNDYAKVTANNTITQLNTDNEIIFSARVHEVDETANTIYLAEYMGPYQNYANTGNGDISLDITLPFRNETGQVISINTPIADNITVSNYIQRTGEVYFMEDFFPLARTDLSREEFKFVLEF
jgi:hypothetical protein